MPRFAANLSLLFTEHPFPARFAAAARAGFVAVEFQFPYDWSLEELAARQQEAGLAVVLHNLPAGDWAAGDRGIACDPTRSTEFRDGLEQAITYAQALGCPRLNCLAGIPPADLAAAEAEATLVANLRHAAAVLAQHDLQLLIEPLNTYDVPGFFLTHAAQALRIIEAVDAPNLALQFDLYHAQRTHGELAASLARYLPHIGHLQIADNPGRHEPGSGEIHFPFLFQEIDRLGYSGWVGCEYHPRSDTESSLDWLPRAAGVHCADTKT